MATCVLSGQVLSGGNPVPNAAVRVRTIGPALVGNAGMAVEDLTTTTNGTGDWSLTLTQGLFAQIDIPAASIMADVQIPSGSNSVSFASLTLYNRGTLTPLTILSDHGPSLGGDLNGASPNPQVVGLRGVPLQAGTPADSQTWVYSVGDGAYKLASVRTGTSVGSVTAGAGVAVTGTSSAPIVSVATAGVVASMLGAGASATNVGALGGDLAGTLPAPTLASGAAATNVGALSGALTGTLPAPSLAGGTVLNTHVGAGAAIAWSKISKAGAVPGDIGAENPSNKGALNGYAPLDGTTKVPLAYLPSTNPVTHASTHAFGQPDAISPASLHAADAVHTHAEADVSGLLSDLADKLSKSAGGTVAGNTTFSNVLTVNGQLIINGVWGQNSDLAFPPVAVATAPFPLKNSYDAVFEASVWNSGGGVAEQRWLVLRNTPTALNAGKLSVIGYGGNGTKGSEVAYIDAVTGAWNGPTAGAHTGTVAGNVTGNCSGTAATFTGSLTGDVTSTAMTTVVAFVGGQSAANVAAGVVLANTATDANTASTIVKRTAGGAFAATTITATTFVGALTGNATTAGDGLASASGTAPLTLNLAAKALTGSVAAATTGALGVVQLAGDLNGTGASPGVAQVGGYSAANVAAGATLANAAVSANTPNAIVKRDGSGNFIAGQISATTFVGALTGASTSCSGNAASATLAAGLSATLIVAQGGSGATSLTGYLKGNGTSPFTAQAVPIPVADGGTGTTSAFTTGAIPFAGASGIYQSQMGANQQLFWDNTSYRLGIRTNTPSNALTVAGIIESTTGGIKFPDGSVQTIAATGGGTGNITGSGAVGQIPIWSGTYTQLGDTSFNFDTSTKRLGIGTATPGEYLHVKHGANNVIARLEAAGAAATAAVTFSSRAGTSEYIVQSGVSSTDRFGIWHSGGSSWRLLIDGATGKSWFGGTSVPTYGLLGVNGNIEMLPGSAGKLYFPDGTFMSTAATGLTGSGTAGQVTFWTGATGLSSDATLVWDNTNKGLGVGASVAAGEGLRLQKTQGATGALTIGITGYAQKTAADTGGLTGLHMQGSYVASSGTQSGIVRGIQGTVASAADGVINDARSVHGASNHAKITSGLTVTNNSRFYASEDVGATATITNNYGLYVESLTRGSTLNYAVYTAGTTPSYFGGSIGVNVVPNANPFEGRVASGVRYLKIGDSAGGNKEVGLGWDVTNQRAVLDTGAYGYDFTINNGALTVKSAATGFVGLNTFSPLAPFHVNYGSGGSQAAVIIGLARGYETYTQLAVNGDNVNGNITFTEYNQNAGAQIILRAAPGTPGVTALGSGARIGSITGRGWDGSQFDKAGGSDAMFGMYAAAAWTTISRPAFMTFETTPSGSISRLSTVIVNSNGYLGIGASMLASPSTQDALVTNPLTINTGATPTLSQVRLRANSAGALGLMAYAVDDVGLSLDADWSASAWTARHTSAFAIRKASGALNFYADSGLTNGNTFTPTARMTFTNAGLLGIGASITPAATLDVAGSTAFRAATLTLANGANQNVTTPVANFLVVSGPSAVFSIGGLTLGVDGRRLTIVNNTAYVLTLNHQDGSSSAANRIYCWTGAGITVPTYGSAELVYLSGTNNWFIVGRSN